MFPTHSLERLFIKYMFNKINKFEINGLTLKMTCTAFPEQYDVFDKNYNQVGYIRLRNGWLYCSIPDCSDDIIYEAYPNGADGCFVSDKQRSHYLKVITNLLNNQ